MRRTSNFGSYPMQMRNTRRIMTLMRKTRMMKVGTSMKVS